MDNENTNYQHSVTTIKLISEDAISEINDVLRTLPFGMCEIEQRFKDLRKTFGEIKEIATSAITENVKSA